MRQRFLFLICVILFLNSCLGDDADVQKTTDLGSFNLLEETITGFPYTGKTSVTFVDSSGIELTLGIKEFPTTSSRFEFKKSDNPSETVYSYNTQLKKYELFHEGRSIRMIVDLAVAPYPENPESKNIADLVYVYYYNAVKNPELVFSTDQNQRTWPKSFEVSKPQLTIFGKEFKNVYINDLKKPISTVFYTKSEGIISFTEINGKKWRLK